CGRNVAFDNLCVIENELQAAMTNPLLRGPVDLLRPSVHGLASSLRLVAPRSCQRISRPCNDLQCRDSGLVQRNIMEDLPGLPDQSALTPANFTTLADFSVSSTRSLPKSADEPGRAVAPNSANRAFILGSARAALISLLSLSTISAGVLFGAPTPVQNLDSYPGTNSATVGMSGNTGERVAVVTASARSLPPLTYSIDEDIVANMTCTCPLSRSTSAGPAPRYGTCTRLTPVIILNSSPKIWFPEPMPPDAMLILPELTLA